MFSLLLLLNLLILIIRFIYKNILLRSEKSKEIYLSNRSLFKIMPHYLAAMFEINLRLQGQVEERFVRCRQCDWITMAKRTDEFIHTFGSFIDYHYIYE